MNITSTESTLTTREEVEPFMVVVPPDCGRDSGQRWQVERIDTTRTVEFDGFGRWVTIGEPDVRILGRRLNQNAQPYGSQHLLYWFHDREAVEALHQEMTERIARLTEQLKSS